MIVSPNKPEPVSVTIELTGIEAQIFKKLTNSPISKLNGLGLTDAEGDIVQSLWHGLEHAGVKYPS